MIQDPIRFSPCGELQALTNPTDNTEFWNTSNNDEYGPYVSSRISKSHSSAMTVLVMHHVAMHVAEY